MGANTFFTRSSGTTARSAFDAAVEDALYEYGHRGYTGTIAEKTEYVEIPLPQGEDAFHYAESLIDKGDSRINNKWGPAGCLEMPPDQVQGFGFEKEGERVYLFFGWASA